MTNYPNEHITDSRELVADAYVDLFKVIFNNGSVLYVKNNDAVTWQGNTYEALSLKLDQSTEKATGEVSRPKISIGNPEGIFTSFVQAGDIEGGFVHRYRLLRQNVLNNVNTFSEVRWRMSRVSLLSNKGIVIELRSVTDGVNFITPGRVFIPSEGFPTVSL